jgi:hypothetical protein
MLFRYILQSDKNIRRNVSLSTSSIDKDILCRGINQKPFHTPAATPMHIQYIIVCAVAAAIRAGGVKIEGANAKDFWRSLENVGFVKVYGTPIAGDVAVIDALPGPGQYGHACIYDGAGTWYSDFRQNSLYPGPTYRKLQPSVTFYRHY